KLFLYLVWTAENMGVILCKAPYPGQSMQLPALLVPIYGTKLRIPYGQVFIRSWLMLIDFAVMRTVHRFQQKFLSFIRGGDWLKRVLPVFLVMPRGLVQGFMPNMGSNHLLIARLVLLFFQEVYQS